MAIVEGNIEEQKRIKRALFPSCINLKARTGVFPFTKGSTVCQKQENSMKALPTNLKESGQARYASDEGRWQAVVRKDRNADGKFYCANSSQMLGMKPKNYRGGGTGATIRFATGECSLGSILVAASEKGVCAILMGDHLDALAKDLQDRFPKANLIGGDRDFEKLVAKVVGFIEAPRLGLDLPLDVRGTAFQQRVWQALREIPAGSTTSYSKIADRIGVPKAIRAVGQACASNAIAVAIPCHRVLRNDGKLSGYRWGVERKRALLEREKVAA